MKRIALFSCVSIVLISYFSQCSKKKSPAIASLTENKKYSLLLTNEGNFGRGTASLSVLKDTVLGNDIFSTTNGRPLGDVAQSIAVIKDKIYVTLNNSAKIEVMNLSDFKSIATITSGSKFAPEYITVINDSLAAVSDLKSDSMTVINTNNYTVKGFINVGAKNYQMTVANNQLFVATSKDISIIALSDVNHLAKTDQINEIASQGSKLVVDKNNNIWSLTSNGLVCIHPATKSIIKTISLNGIDIETKYGGSKLDINLTKDTLFFNSSSYTATSNGIYAVPIVATTSPTSALFTYDKTLIQAFYNFGISPQHTIYICDALDYTQRGKLYEFAQNSKLLHSYQTGIIPQYIYFF